MRWRVAAPPNAAPTGNPSHAKAGLEAKVRPAGRVAAAGPLRGQACLGSSVDDAPSRSQHQQHLRKAQEHLAPGAEMQFASARSDDAGAEAGAEAGGEGTEKAEEEGEEPKTAAEIAEEQAEMQEAIQEQKQQAVQTAQEAASDFEECVQNCRRDKEEAMAEAFDASTTAPDDPNKECCVDWYNYLCFCFAGGCCGGDDS